METNRMIVDGSEEKIDAALAEAERFAEYQGLNEKQARRIRLLAEEMMGMIRGITGDYTAYFWVEGTDSLCKLRLRAKTELDYLKREELIKSSTSKKNASFKGLGGKIRELFEMMSESYHDAVKYNPYFGMQSYSPEKSLFVGQADTDWSLSKYKEVLEDQKGENPEIDQEWDELERSVLAKLADEVKVGIKDGNVDVTVEKKL